MKLNRRNFLRHLGTAAMLAAAPRLARAATKARVLVIGGGFAGATVAKYLKLWGAETVDVTLIEPQPRHVSCVLSNLVLNDQLTLEQLSLPFTALTENYGIQVLRDSAEEIDAGAARVRLRRRGWTSYDRLILAPGISFDTISGLDPTLIPHAWIAGESTSLLRAQLHSMPVGGRFVMTVPPSPYRCPPGPYERACLVADLVKRRGGGEVIVLDANDSIQAERATFSRAFTELYGDIIDYRSGVTVNAVDSQARVLTTSDGELGGDVLNVIPGQKAPELLRSAGLTDSARWAPIDPLTYQSTLPGYAGIHIVGDAQNSNQPKSAHMANSQAKVCADAILRSLSGVSNTLPERTANITTNSACYSPITQDQASWLTANFAYDTTLGAMQLAHIGEAESWDRESYQEMFVWANNLFNDSFGNLPGPASETNPDGTQALMPILHLLLDD